MDTNNHKEFNMKPLQCAKKDNRKLDQKCEVIPSCADQMPALHSVIYSEEKWVHQHGPGLRQLFLTCGTKCAKSIPKSYIFIYNSVHLANGRLFLSLFCLTKMF